MNRGYLETGRRVVLVLLEVVTQRIFLARGQKGQLDFGLASLYDATLRRFNEQIKRNVERLNDDSCFR
jgi:hypothetical protein